MIYKENTIILDLADKNPLLSFWWFSRDLDEAITKCNRYNTEESEATLERTVG